jgi:hypothetical protein
LGLIVLLLGVIAFKPAVTSRAVVAAAPTEWSCVADNPDSDRVALNCSEKLKIAQQQGWEPFPVPREVLLLGQRFCLAVSLPSVKAHSYERRR